MNRLPILWFSAMGPYGIYREWNVDRKPPFDLYGHRIAASVANGIIYVSPLGIFKLFNLLNRIDVWYHQRDPKHYPNCYHECMGYNYHLF
jgi:hypothetical protein